jgi:hypothetical protein
VLYHNSECPKSEDVELQYITCQNVPTSSTCHKSDGPELTVYHKSNGPELPVYHKLDDPKLEFITSEKVPSSSNLKSEGPELQHIRSQTVPTSSVTEVRRSRSPVYHKSVSPELQ